VSDGTHATVVVVSGGDPLPRRALEHIPAGAFVIAADSGLDRAAEAALPVDVVVGDFDSVGAAALAAAVGAGTGVLRHSVVKDQTDLELALDLALTKRPERVIVLGGDGGRLDHFLANTLLLASPAYAEVDLVAFMGPARMTVVRTAATLTGEPGDIVTLLPVHGPAYGVRSVGLLYALVGDDLAPGTTRGVSNELAEREARVSLEAGTLLAIQPGEAGLHFHNGIGPSSGRDR
jgi:thiamine pyrophosphokinase